ncbi:MFS transporter [Streptomyces spinoverrucosus]|uniref:MFS transporter n=1 Tax=Streptomyces spinoverrucosus TaxID=284043 RepID=UPI0018C40AD0|nr:MFS transporter [Streptomyces spinoverrucosus]MBG0850441.1 MFS transporter [Streptomyces spinoverrucosus]
MSYRSLLRLAGVGFFPLGFLARLPYAASALSTLILVQASTHSYAFAGLASAAQSIAIAIGGPLVGALADRYGHRSVGAAAAIANFAAWAALLAASRGTQESMLAAATLVGLTQPQVGPLVRVHWSRLVRSHNEHHLLSAALSYEASADEMSFVAGPALVGLLASVSPLAPAVATMSLIAASTLPFALLYSHRATQQPASGDRGKPYLPRRPLAVMFLAMAAMGAVFGAIQTAVTVYADTIDEPGASGLVYAEFGIGSALVGAACAWLPPRFSLRARYVSFAATLCAGMLILFAGAQLVSLPVAVALASFTVAPYMISLYALTERLAPTERAAVAMTILCAGGPLGTAGGQAVSGNLAEGHGVEGALLVALVVAAGALLLALWACLADRGRNIWIVDCAPAKNRAPREPVKQSQTALSER